jgi:hypothetical protein
VGKSARKKPHRPGAMSRPQPVSSSKRLPAGGSAAKSATRVTPAKPEEFPPKKLINLTFIVLATALFGLWAISAREPDDGAWGMIFIVVSAYGLTLMWDFWAKLMSVYGPASIRSIYKVLFGLWSNPGVLSFLVFCLTLIAAALALILYSPSVASSWGSLLPARSRDVSALVVSVLSGELAVLAFGGCLWFRRLRKRPSPRFGYHDMAEGLGDLAWTLAMISIAFGAAGSTSNLDWLVITGVFVPVLINLRRQGYRDPRRVAAGSQRTEKE